MKKKFILPCNFGVMTSLYLHIICMRNLALRISNYTMSDLPKMQLTYFAIKVGKINKQDLRVEKEFEFGTNKSSKRADYTGESNDQETTEIDVYDVVLAGVVEDNG